MNDPIVVPDSNTRYALQGVLAAISDAHMDLAHRRVQYLVFESSALSRIQAFEESVNSLLAKLIRENGLDPKDGWVYDHEKNSLTPGGQK